jgi:TRAP-type C4-dicarboxylate transport system substrate-binding protein
LVEIAAGVTQRSGGRLIITVYPATALGYTADQAFTAMTGGALEMACVFDATIAGLCPITGLTNLPFLIPTSKMHPSAVEGFLPYYTDALAKNNIMILSTWGTSETDLACIKKVERVEDWKGLKLRGPTPTIAEIIKAMGATPVSIPQAEAYSAVATKIVDGIPWSAVTTYDNRLYEVAKYFNHWAITRATLLILVNKSRFDELPADIQDIVRNTAKELEPKAWDAAVWKGGPAYFDKLKAEGMNIVEISDQEKAKAMALTSQVWDKWLKRTGPEGQKALNAALKAMGRPSYKP